MILGLSVKLSRNAAQRGESALLAVLVKRQGAHWDVGRLIRTGETGKEENCEKANYNSEGVE